MNRWRSAPAIGGSGRSFTWVARSRKRASMASTSRSGMPLPIDPPAEDRVSRAHPIEEQQPVEVVELVEDGPGLERVDLQDAVAAVWGETPHHQPGGAGHVAG